MITYEPHLHCDKCDNHINVAEADTPNEAEANVRRHGESLGWRFNEFGDYCPTCKAKVETNE